MELSKIISLQKMARYVSLGVSPVGLILLIVGIAVGIWLLAPLGFILMAGGIFSAVVLWGYEKEYTRMQTLCNAIEKENMETMSELAQKLSLPESDIRRMVGNCMTHKYLVGYIRVGDRVVLKSEYEKEVAKENSKTYARQCPNCGANYIATDGDDCCPYCTSGR